MFISHKENMINAFQTQQIIFTKYEIENTRVNERAHYTSDHGTVQIWYGDCGLWIVGPSDNR